MLGYLRPHQPTRAQRCLANSYLCSLCHTLGEEYGFIYRLFARTDLVFFNVFMDALQDGPPEVQARSCVLLPGIRKQATRAITDHTRFTAAYGLYMAVEKLRDDVDDEGGLHRWLLLKVFAPGHRRARQVLIEAGYPVVRSERWLGRQAELEQRPELALEAAAVPSAVLGGQLFAHAGRQRDPGSGRLARGIGRRVGAFLFYMDSLLDLHRDRRGRQYNPLLRLPAPAGTPVDEEVARQRAVTAIESELQALKPLLGQMAVSDPGGYVAAVLDRGLRDKLRRYLALDARQIQRGRLSSIQPPPRHGPFVALRRWRQKATDGLRLAGALVLTTLAPRSPALGRVAAVLVMAAAALLPELTHADGGVDAGASLDAGTGGGTRSGSGACSGCGESLSDSCSESCAEIDPCQACGDACGEACGNACNEACSNACGDVCGSGGCCS